MSADFASRLRARRKERRLSIQKAAGMAESAPNLFAVFREIHGTRRSREAVQNIAGDGI
jgi:hypothetical protein